MKKFLKIALFTILLFLVGILKVQAKENINITDVELEEKSEYVIINEDVSLDNNKITSNINFYDEGDYVIYKLTIKNSDDQDYKIEDILDDNTSEYLSFEYDYKDGVLKAKSTKEVLLKITYVSLLPYDSVLTPDHTFTANTEVNISFKLIDYVSNPSTLDRIGKQSFTVILCVLLLFAFVKLRKSKFLYVLVLGLFLIPIGTNAEREISFNIKLNNNIEAEVNFLSQYWKDKVSGTYSKIEFVKRASFPNDAVDVSQEEDNSIKAWIEDGTLYFGSRYRIFFPVNSQGLFYNLGVTEINFNNRVDTTFVNEMISMLRGNNFKEIDVSSFRTGNVTRMDSMFSFNNEIKELDLSTFDMSHVQYFTDMFKECALLEEVIIDNWDLSSIQYASGVLFDYRYSLKTISAKNMIFPVNSSSFFRCDNNVVSSLESIDLTGSDTSLVTNMYAMFQNQVALKELKGIEDFDTSKVTNMGYMFAHAFKNAQDLDLSLDLSNWDVSKVQNMEYMFYYFAKDASGSSIDFKIDGWDAAVATNMNYIFNYFAHDAEVETINFEIYDLNIPNVSNMIYGFYGLGSKAGELNVTVNNITNNELASLNNAFRQVGCNAGKVIFNVDELEFNKATDLTYAFNEIGYKANEVEINVTNIDMPILNDISDIFRSSGEYSNRVTITLENFNIPNVQNTHNSFEYIGDNGNYVTVTLKNWDMSNCLSVYRMFNYFAANTKEEVNLTLENVDISSATSLDSMFYTAGRNAKKYNFKFVNVDTSSAEDMDYMFTYSGMGAEEWSFEGLDELDLTHVTTMKRFMHQISSSKGPARDIGTLDIYGADISDIFYSTTRIKGTVNLHGNPTINDYILLYTATSDDSELIINYTSDVDIDTIMSKKDQGAHVIKGSLLES